MGKSKIEWCDKTWNPVTGCTKISPGCQNCYAERMAHRLQAMGQKRYQNGFKVTCHPDVLVEPLYWRKPSKVFVCSMSDLFHDDVPFDFFEQLMHVVRVCTDHTFLFLTKRPERMQKFFDTLRGAPCEQTAVDEIQSWWSEFLPLPNVWIGVTAENQERADVRIPILLQIPAAKRFVSVEPMLGPVDLRHIQYDNMVEIDSLTGDHGVIRPLAGRSDRKLDWVICGGESGPGARPMHPDWVRRLRDQCQAAGVPFLFKQWGEWSPDSNNEPILPLMDKCKHGIWDDAGKWHVGEGPFSRYENIIGYSMYLIGKKKAGRMLDGQLWDQYPEED